MLLIVREARLLTLLSLLNNERIPFEVEKAMAGMDTMLVAMVTKVKPAQIMLVAMVTKVKPAQINNIS
jgi:hypothetical protein